MKVFFGIVPWITFFVLIRFLPNSLGVSAGSALLIYLGFIWKRISTAKLLDYCSILFFINVFIFSYSNYSTWIVTNMNYLVNGWFACIVFSTILLRSPFTLSYAKEITTEEQAKTRIFYIINMIISLAWLLFFISSLIIELLLHKLFVWYWFVKVFLVVIIVMLTKKIPAWFINQNEKLNYYEQN